MFGCTEPIVTKKLRNKARYGETRTSCLETSPADIASVDGCVAQVSFLTENMGDDGDTGVDESIPSSWDVLSATTSYVIILASKPLPGGACIMVYII